MNSEGRQGGGYFRALDDDATMLGLVMLCSMRCDVAPLQRRASATLGGIETDISTRPRGEDFCDAQ